MLVNLARCLSREGGGETTRTTSKSQKSGVNSLNLCGPTTVVLAPPELALASDT
jgi:hypothetical protein